MTSFLASRRLATYSRLDTLDRSDANARDPTAPGPETLNLNLFHWSTLVSSLSGRWLWLSRLLFDLPNYLNNHATLRSYRVNPVVQAETFRRSSELRTGVSHWHGTESPDWLWIEMESLTRWSSRSCRMEPDLAIDWGWKIGAKHDKFPEKKDSPWLENCVDRHRIGLTKSDFIEISYNDQFFKHQRLVVSHR